MQVLTVVFASVLFYTGTESMCRHSYMTFCDNLSDLQNYNVENWTELVVGTESHDDSQLQAVDSDSLSLDRLEKVVTFIIIGQIRDIKTYTFTLDPFFNRLNYLQLYGNDIRRIRFTTFDTMKLTKLSLVNNKIEYIHAGAFYNCEIKTIDLSHNKLETIETDVFSEEFFYNSTKEIVIRYNEIGAIQSDSFPSSLEILNLDHNNLKVLNADVFDNLDNLQELTLSHNQLSSLGFVKNLEKLKLLDVSHNKIVALTSQHFNNLTQLQVLDLSHNQLAYPQIFQKFNIPERHPPLQISLAFNKLTHLVIEENNFRQHIVFLYGNPWNCKCWQMMEKFMLDNKVKRNVCDLKFFGNGDVPYCIEFDKSDCRSGDFGKDSNISQRDIQNFVKVVEGSLDMIRCRLTPRIL
ncbi:insulin-like growth factor-binding protein complex acid labile subunit [Tribolium castaneum]|uniref:insulin-like growth factor-binding protein complex acid labile subunit n=1 Tax=Tribolium castaneum TaxID=7070 RepID=UPI00046C0FA5|nr:PREDICTED: insulin-like growth factor-binding protein complex acid labile subunit [Tribolium castaneum]XP_015834418.1 PREDICTED: insulin-like growth factor-binding protein complex acid labile subunit [Tribolium castaneum]|eukprot:XP_008191917.1 PREDICTED: insulin-like growth factor-binding protein complex acid labile subunit [Tribolium castaneum]